MPRSSIWLRGLWSIPRNHASNPPSPRRHARRKRNALPSRIPSRSLQRQRKDWPPCRRLPLQLPRNGNWPPPTRSRTASVTATTGVSWFEARWEQRWRAFSRVWFDFVSRSHPTGSSPRWKCFGRPRRSPKNWPCKPFDPCRRFRPLRRESRSSSRRPSHLCRSRRAGRPSTSTTVFRIHCLSTTHSRGTVPRPSALRKHIRKTLHHRVAPPPHRQSALLIPCRTPSKQKKRTWNANSKNGVRRD